MGELFRFNLLRAPTPLAADAHVSLDHDDSALQQDLAAQKGTNLPARTRRLALVFLQHNRDGILRIFADGNGPATSAAMEAIKLLPATDNIDETVRAVIHQWTQRSVDQLAEVLRSDVGLVSDALVALRLYDPTVEALTSILGRADIARLLVDRARLVFLLDSMTTGPLDSAHFTAARDAKLSTRYVDLVSKAGAFIPDPAPTAAEDLAAARAALASLTELILRVERAAPVKLEVDANRVILANQFALALMLEFADLPEQLRLVLGDDLAPLLELEGEWAPLHARLTNLARDVQRVIDQLVLDVQAAAPGLAASPATSSTPIAAGHMRVAGMSEVKVVRHHIKSYERGELAHIENILEGEDRKRQFRTLNRTEDETSSETESSTTEETEIKTEDSSSIKSSVDQVLKENIDLKVGFDLKAKAGAVEIGLNTSFAFGRSKEETKRDAIEFAKSVTNRAARKVSETVRTSVKQKLIHETEEIVKHRFNNPASAGTGNVSGMYQWVEKVYTMQMFEIGRERRAIVDGIVLQPGQRLLGTPAVIAPELANATPPPAFDVLPSQIHPWNYQSLAATYGATGVPSPPSLTTTASLSSANPQSASDRKNATMSFAQDIALGDGTAAAYASMTLSVEIHADPDFEVGVGAIGTQAFTLTGAIDSTGKPTLPNVDLINDRKPSLRVMRLVETKVLAGERGLVPCTVYAVDTIGFAAAITVTCVRTPESYEAWQLACYGALAAAHAKAKQDYDELVARLSVQQTYVPPSPGSAENTIREELKRCVIALLAEPSNPAAFAASLDNFYAGGQSAEISRRCLFFEHALEWENMTFVLYPYFWSDGRNDGWNHRTRRDQPSAQLAEFLRAGAARVVVPVRPLPKDAAKDAQSFQDYLAAADLPNLDDLVDVDSPLRIAIEDELKALAGDTDDEIWLEDWDVHVSTELVQLRDLAAPLPTWKEAEDPISHEVIKGVWVEDA